MPQLRQDPTTKEWVIIAAERSKRPHDFIKTKTVIEKPPYKEDCPFCQGNEHLTPHESLAYRRGGWADGKGWWVRVIPNRFSALSPEGSWERKEEKDFFRMMVAALTFFISFFVRMFLKHEVCFRIIEPDGSMEDFLIAAPPARTTEKTTPRYH